MITNENLCTYYAYRAIKHYAKLPESLGHVAPRTIQVISEPTLDVVDDGGPCSLERKAKLAPKSTEDNAQAELMKGECLDHELLVQSKNVRSPALILPSQQDISSGRCSGPTGCWVASGLDSVPETDSKPNSFLSSHMVVFHSVFVKSAVSAGGFIGEDASRWRDAFYHSSAGSVWYTRYCWHVKIHHIVCSFLICSACLIKFHLLAVHFLTDDVYVAVRPSLQEHQNVGFN